MRAHVRGQVLLRFVIEADGTVGPVCVATGLEDGLDAEAIATARQWLFRPATRDGQPLPTVATMNLDFKVK